MLSDFVKQLCLYLHSALLTQTTAGVSLERLMFDLSALVGLPLYDVTVYVIELI